MADTTANTDSYHVLARKYRPADFDALIGQEAMVRTLKNAIDAGRLAHAFVLTGVRGVGKTTTARIIAKALNCIGPDGTTDGPTITPCGQCEHCVAIAESRHVDVLEMDAASRTGVDDIREIIDGVRYAAVSARFKIYIIDEVHMLSKNAFNALLKTLEEPPAHVKVLFATTEIRKLPVTVLSRCQRFDLKRVEADRLVAHFASVAGQEGAEVEDAALKLIARAAEGSVRDGLSLLDQAIAHGGQVGEAAVRDMLGLADRARVLDLFEAVMAGKTAETLAILREQTDLGADPAVVLSDLAEATHWITRLKAVPDAGGDALVSEAERAQGGAMAEKLTMPALTRAWQMLLKGIGPDRDAEGRPPGQARRRPRPRPIDTPRPGPPADAARSRAGGQGGRPLRDGGRDGGRDGRRGDRPVRRPGAGAQTPSGDGRRRPAASVAHQLRRPGHAVPRRARGRAGHLPVGPCAVGGLRARPGDAEPAAGRPQRPGHAHEAVPEGVDRPGLGDHHRLGRRGRHAGPAGHRP